MGFPPKDPIIPSDNGRCLRQTSQVTGTKSDLPTEGMLTNFISDYNLHDRLGNNKE